MADSLWRANGSEALGLAADVTRQTDVEAMVARTLDRFGRLDILVNNAGVNIRGPIEQLTEDDWDLVSTPSSRAPGSAAARRPSR